MASIQKRKLKGGGFNYRVRFRRNDYPQYSVEVTFVNLDDANDFIDEYEPLFKSDPKAMFELREEFRKDMRRRDVLVESGMKKPRFRV